MASVLDLLHFHTAVGQIGEKFSEWIEDILDVGINCEFMFNF